MLDNCASGGKRIDLEMLKRMVILHRTDYTCVPYGDGEGQFNMEGIQWQNQNLSYWLPLHGATLGYPVYLFEDSYLARSMLSAGVALGIQVGYAADMPLAQKMTREMSDFRGISSATTIRSLSRRMTRPQSRHSCTSGRT